MVERRGWLRGGDAEGGKVMTVSDSVNGEHGPMTARVAEASSLESPKKFENLKERE